MGGAEDAGRAEWFAGESDEAVRLDKWVVERTNCSRTSVQREIRDGFVTVNGRSVRPSYALRQGDRIQRRPPPAPPAERLLGEDMEISVVFHDSHLVVVDKAPGLVVYPAAGHWTGTLLNGLMARFPGLADVTGAPVRPGVVHRLDKDTSGLMVVALSDAAYHGLRAQFDGRSIRRRYLALVTGAFREDTGVMDSSIGRSERDRKKMSTRTRRGKPAVTEWRTLERYRDASLVAFALRTGRTHQIRVHCLSMGHPILGDRTYGGRPRIEGIRFPRQMLHAETLGFVHPVQGGDLLFRSPLPEDMARVVRAFRERG